MQASSSEILLASMMISVTLALMDRLLNLGIST
jgi:hypothetical protein